MAATSMASILASAISSKRPWALLCLILACAFTPSAFAEGVYLSQDQFLAESFDGEPPPAQLMWLTGPLREQVSDILGHAPRAARVRYWSNAQRSAWVLEEIGKEQPITMGFVVDSGELHATRVLIYRESRGWEIRHDFFTRQFERLRLTEQHRLSGPVDNISGATLSVSAARRMARVALLLDRHRPHS